jgi:hypothetical protein
MSKNNSPVFIVGVDRSGTTLLGLMIDAHSKIAILYESNIFERYYPHRELFDDLRDRKDRLALVNSILSTPCVKKWDIKIVPKDIDLSKCNNLQSTINEVYLAYAHSLGKNIWYIY